MSITAHSTLKVLDTLISELSDTEGTECIQLCMTIDYILDKLKLWANESQDARDNHPCPAKASSFITEMEGPLYSIAGLNGYVSDKRQNIIWLKASLRRLAGVHCFAINE